MKILAPSARVLMCLYGLELYISLHKQIALYTILYSFVSVRPAKTDSKHFCSVTFYEI